ncbi:lysophospholipid acyltransferase family protein [Fusobacterium necrophorum]|uniref:lysophospholipid acyltransferase family protein n=1 Tax=Fusobacterium necrophorum TaxID=859 RepID=UPI00370E9263
MIRELFYGSLVKFLCHFIIGREVEGKEILPEKGPAILIANHNSHLDALMILSLFPRNQIRNIYAVGAKDYFFRNPILSFFSKHFIGVIPLDRKVKKEEILNPIYTAIEEGKILLIFPEGTRNLKGTISPFKNGISKIAQKYPELAFYPIVLSGLRRVLAKNEKIMVPFISHIYIKSAEFYHSERHEFMDRIFQIFSQQLEHEKNM